MTPLQRNYIEEIVFAHTESALSPAQSEDDRSAVERVQAILAARLARLPSTARAAYPRKSLVASDAESLAQVEATRAAVAKGLAAPPQIEGFLPERFALWPLDAASKAAEPVPAEAAWIRDVQPKATIAAQGDERVGVFESEVLPDESALPLVTSLAPPRAPGATPKPLLATIFSVLGFLLFAMALFGALTTGTRIGDARDILRGDATLVGERLGTSLSEAQATCLEDIRGANAAYVLTIECRGVWESALSATPRDRSRQGWGEWLLDWFAVIVLWPFTLLARSGPGIASGSELSILSYFIAAITGLALLFVGLGFGTLGRWSGAVVSPQNRLSLSLFQVTGWTILILGAYAIYSAFNIGLLGEASLVAPPPDDAGFFPKLEGWTWAVMGITVASPFVSSVIKGLKPGVPDLSLRDALRPVRAGRLGLTLDALARKPSVEQASLGDLFYGEDVSDHTRIDMTRTQNVIISALLFLTYAAWVAIPLAGLPHEALLAAFKNTAPVLGSLPDPGSTFVALIGLSHAAYLVGKAQPAGQTTATQTTSN